MPDPIAWAIVCFVGALLAMDRTVAFQTMISRPITAGPIIGLVLGHPMVGVILGAFFELLWMGRLPLGGHLPPNACFATIITTAAVVLSAPEGKPIGRDLIAFGFLFGPPIARLAALLERRLRDLNGMLLQKATRGAAEGRLQEIPRLQWTALAITFISAVVFILVCLPLVQYLIQILYPTLPSAGLKALNVLYYVIPLFGIAAALGSVNVQRNYLVYSICFVGALFLLLI